MKYLVLSWLFSELSTTGKSFWELQIFKCKHSLKGIKQQQMGEDKFCISNIKEKSNVSDML